MTTVTLAHVLRLNYWLLLGCSQYITYPQAPGCDSWWSSYHHWLLPEHSIFATCLYLICWSSGSTSEELVESWQRDWREREDWPLSTILYKFSRKPNHIHWILYTLYGFNLGLTDYLPTFLAYCFSQFFGWVKDHFIHNIYLHVTEHARLN